MISSALQERFLAGFGQGSGVMTHDSALGTPVNEHRPSSGTNLA
jgi:hypothetical protein